VHLAYIIHSWDPGRLLNGHTNMHAAGSCCCSTYTLPTLMLFVTTMYDTAHLLIIGNAVCNGRCKAECHHDPPEAR